MKLTPHIRGFNQSGTRQSWKALYPMATVSFYLLTSKQLKILLGKSAGRDHRVRSTGERKVQRCEGGGEWAS